LGVDLESASIDSLIVLARSTNFTSPASLITLSSIDSFLCSPTIAEFVSAERCRHLAELFNLYGSDKAKDHDYHRVYQSIVDSLRFEHRPILVSEIGLGTNNLDTPSNMGIYGSPGASAKAFRDYDDLITVLGGDVDQRILFAETRITTLKVDQLDITSLRNFICKHRPTLLIDDGLHTPRSNLNVLSVFVDYVLTEQPANIVWLVIEDISLDSKCLSMWLAVLSSLPSPFDSWLVESNLSALAVCRFNPSPSPKS
jgi:hypothetical protein